MNHMNKYKTVEAFLADLDPSKSEQVTLLREIIKTAQPSLEEHIKWNAPSYIHDGEDRITFNLFNKEGVVKLVFHMGAKRKEDKNAAPLLADDFGLVVWSSDIRGTVSFASLADIEANKEPLTKLVKNWLEVI
jgi:hypothetical protein